MGYVNFMNGWWENWRVRCGWMYYACFLPVYGLFRSKTPPYRHVKNPPFSTMGGYWGNREIMIISRDIFPIWIHSEKFPVKTLTHIFSQHYYRFTIIPIYYLIYTHIIFDIQSLFRVHIAISVHYTRTL